MDKLKEACKEYMDFLKSDDFYEDMLFDYEHRIFEEALEFIYGDDIFNEVNELIE